MYTLYLDTLTVTTIQLYVSFNIACVIHIYTLILHTYFNICISYSYSSPFYLIFDSFLFTGKQK